MLSPEPPCGRFAQSYDADDLQQELVRQYFIPQRPRGRRDRGGAPPRDDDDHNDDDGDDGGGDDEAQEDQEQQLDQGEGSRFHERITDGQQEGTIGSGQASGSGFSEERSSSTARASGSSGVIEWASDTAKKRYRPRYNVPPKSNSAVLLRDKTMSARSRAERYSLDLLQWGLIPAWSKEPPEGGPLHTINCTYENLSQGTPLWRSVRDSKRCIVVADGFYEWLTKGKDKLPHFIKPADGRLLCMAGLYDHATRVSLAQIRDTFGDSFDPVTTFTIITVPANQQMSTLHHRMPAILQNPEEIRLWLSEEKWTKPVENLIRPYERELTIYQVPKGVGKVGNESPTFIEPIKGAPGTLETMFAKQNSQGSPNMPKSASAASPKWKSSSPVTLKKAPATHKRKKESSIEVIDLLDDSDGAAEGESDADAKPAKKLREAS
ncbi:BZ3500_MvSof-1268-A1-R1_Chr3-3g06456 [Microbotryum saponariae]|uniref:BZ3500_MvSof-1268-A1-R1_Chr3-3g06456 protein n=1 Tax=Microbotryum saponariae TaxID=289078 RepID=A0A2X0LY93_9BASI|nr:BZ3500_MvSof-1268-A1-R1_Chr3-3g06456 [Microbotryum saponariae]SDA04423.1 BZ3501_MvSof-1269-A2-R1_Chr3-2g06143 [Microbotryum saponariae]